MITKTHLRVLCLPERKRQRKKQAQLKCVTYSGLTFHDASQETVSLHISFQVPPVSYSLPNTRENTQTYRVLAEAHEGGMKTWYSGS